MADLAVVISCEHGGNEVPAGYRDLFAAAADVLASHRGFDAGALEVAQALAAACGAALVSATTTRLLVDLNRSAGHPQLFSEFTRALAPDAKRTMLTRHYAPYRDRVAALVATAIGRGERVLHVSSHSFTPVLDGRERMADLGLLYDPRRAGEKAIADAWARDLGDSLPGLRIRRNYPYRGAADGLTTHLRRRFPDADYAGFELEVNQALVGREAWRQTVRALGESLRRVAASLAR